MWGRGLGAFLPTRLVKFTWRAFRETLDNRSSMYRR
jgi:hypothetical protein